MQFRHASQAVCEIENVDSGQELAECGIIGERIVAELLGPPPTELAEACRPSSTQATSLQHGTASAPNAGTGGQATAQHPADNDSDSANLPEQPRIQQQPGVRSTLVPTLFTIQAPQSQRRWALHPLAPHTLGDLLRQPTAAEAGLLRGDGGRLLLFQLLSGIAELHASARWHGCLTPEHVLLTRDGCAAGLECCGHSHTLCELRPWFTAQYVTGVQVGLDQRRAERECPTTRAG